MTTIQYLAKLLNDEYFKELIDKCNTPDEIYEITNHRQIATKLARYIESQKPIEPYDELAEATDNGYIPIEVELTQEQLDRIDDMYNMRYRVKP